MIPLAKSYASKVPNQTQAEVNLNEARKYVLDGFAGIHERFNGPNESELSHWIGAIGDMNDWKQSLMVLQILPAWGWHMNELELERSIASNHTQFLHDLQTRFKQEFKAYKTRFEQSSISRSRESDFFLEQQGLSRICVYLLANNTQLASDKQVDKDITRSLCCPPIIRQIAGIGLFLGYVNRKQKLKEELKKEVLNIFDSKIRQFFCIEEAEQDVENTQKDLDDMNALFFPSLRYFDPESSSKVQLNKQLAAQKVRLEQKRKDASLYFRHFSEFIDSEMTQADLEGFERGCRELVKQKADASNYARDLADSRKQEQFNLEKILNDYLSTNDVFPFLYIMAVQEQDYLDAIEDKLLAQLPPREDSILEAKDMLQSYLAQKELIFKKLLAKISAPEGSASRRPPLQILDFANTLSLANIEKQIGVRGKEYVKSLQGLTKSTDIIACVSLCDTPEQGVLKKQFSDWLSLKEIRSDIHSFDDATEVMHMTREDVLREVGYTKASIAPLLDREVGIANSTFAHMQKQLDSKAKKENTAGPTDRLPTLLGQPRFDPSKRG